MHVNFKDIPGEEIAPGVIERILMKKEEGDPEGMCSAYHYILFDGGELVIENQMTEYQHYIISGRTTSGTADTAIFSPAGTHDPVMQAKGLRIQRFKHVGEAEARIIFSFFISLIFE